MNRFAEIFGHQRPIELLLRLLADDRLPQALLFQGPEAVGKASVAERFAACLLCPREDPASCGDCDSCRLVQSRGHPDLARIELLPRPKTSAAEREAPGDGDLRKFIVVEQIREFTGVAALAPRVGRRRVFIIDPADRMNTAAQNALLKTLEEPPGESVLILVAATPFVLLPTIRSRCFAVRFAALPTRELAAWLERRGLEPAEALARASLAEGRPGHALELDLDGLRERREEILETLEALSGKRSALAALPDHAASLAGRNETTLIDWLALAEALLRDAARAAMIADDARLIHADLAERLASISTEPWWRRACSPPSPAAPCPDRPAGSGTGQRDHGLDVGGLWEQVERRDALHDETGGDQLAQVARQRRRIARNENHPLDRQPDQTGQHPTAESAARGIGHDQARDPTAGFVAGDAAFDVVPAMGDAPLAQPARRPATAGHRGGVGVADPCAGGAAAQQLETVQPHATVQLEQIDAIDGSRAVGDQRDELLRTRAVDLQEGVGRQAQRNARDTFLDPVPADQRLHPGATATTGTLTYANHARERRVAFDQSRGKGGRPGKRCARLAQQHEQGAFGPRAANHQPQPGRQRAIRGQRERIRQPLPRRRQQRVRVGVLHGTALDLDHAPPAVAALQAEYRSSVRVPLQTELDLVPVGQRRRDHADRLDLRGLEPADPRQRVANEASLPIALDGLA